MSRRHVVLVRTGLHADKPGSGLQMVSTEVKLYS